jgi:hypothetical protein
MGSKTRARYRAVVVQSVRARRDVVYGLATMAITTVAALFVLEIWRAELDSPFVYRDDANLNLMLVKGLLENGWYLENPSLGAPLGQKLFDYPVLAGDHLNVVVLGLLGIVSEEPGTVVNLFYLLTYPLVALTSFAVMRRLRISAPVALICSSLYALLPYHFLRGETHLLLSAYYAVPLAAYLVLAVLSGEQLFAWRTGKRSGPLALASARTLLTLAICVVVTSASGSFYYAGFTVALLAIATLLRFAVTLDVRVLAGGSAVVAALVVLAVAHIAPTLAYQHHHGRNPEGIKRQPFESEYYSLRLTQLILPLSTHRLEPFARTRETYDAWSASTGIPSTEAAIAALGTVGSLGFLGLLVATLAGAIGSDRRPPLLVRSAGTAAVLAFVVATIGGFSSFIGLVYPQLRAWNRFSIFIAFFALLAVGVALDRAGSWLARRRTGRPLFAGVLAAVLVLGVLDQTNATYVPAYGETRGQYRSDRIFVRMIERRLPRDGAVFQLPYAPFPESVPPPPGRTVVYDMLRPYLHSRDLRWSFGAMQGRPEDWAAQLADMPLAEVLPIVSAVGFDALYLDRFGYPDDASADTAVGELVRLIGRRPQASSDGRLLFFDLRRYNERLRGRLSIEDLERLRAQVLPPSE